MGSSNTTTAGAALLNKLDQLKSIAKSQGLLPYDRSKPISEISWLITHNAYNSQDEIGAAAGDPGGTNQNTSIEAQLADGVRAFMIDIRNTRNAPRVSHWNTPEAHYEDLCDLLTKFKSFLTSPQNACEVILLYLEVDKDVPGEWIRDTFYGAGPITRSGADYNLKDLLFRPAQSCGANLPTLDALIQLGTRVVVFRETDDGKGQMPADQTGMEWYQDLWARTTEVPYGNSSWTDLKFHTQQLLRGDHTLPVLLLNHFVNTGHTGSGSAGFAEGMNQREYLTVRALVAWRLFGKRPSLAVDFYKSVAGQSPSYDTRESADDLNVFLTVSGEVTSSTGEALDRIGWTGTGDYQFDGFLVTSSYGIGDTDDSDYKDKDSFTSVPATGASFSFPYLPGQQVQLTPSKSGYVFDPPTFTYNGNGENLRVAFVASRVAAATP